MKNIKYVIGYDARAIIYVWLKVGTTMEDELQAYVHALLLQRILSRTYGQKDDFLPSLLQSTHAQVLQFFGNNTTEGAKEPKKLMERLEQLGWDLRSRLHLGFMSRRLLTTTKED